MTAVLLRGTIRIEGGPPQQCVVEADAMVPYPDQGLPVPPLGFWGGRPPAYVDIGGPGWQPYPDNSLPGPQPHPSHPIVIMPPGAIDGTHPEHPIYLPVYPAHPIVLPPNEPAPEGFTWVYTPLYGWVADPNASGGKPVPITPPR